MAPSNILTVRDVSDVTLIDSLKKFEGCDVLLVREKPDVNKCLSNVVYIYQEKSADSSTDQDSDTASFLPKSHAHSLQYCIKRPNESAFCDGDLAHLPDAEKQGIKNRFPKWYDANRLYDAKQLNQVFKITRKNKHTTNETGIFALFQANPGGVAAGLKALYPIDEANELDADKRSKNLEKRLKFLKMLKEVQLVYDTLIGAGMDVSSYYFSPYVKVLAKIKEDLTQEEKESRKKQNKKIPKNFSDILFGETIKMWNSRENKANKFSMGLNALFFTTSFATAVASLAAPFSAVSAALSHAMATHITATVWDDADTGTGSISAYNQYLQGEEKIAFWNALGQAQMFASTALTCLAIDLYFSPLIVLPAIGVSGILGFSLAVAMLVPIYIERYAEKKCKEELKFIFFNKLKSGQELTRNQGKKEKCITQIAKALGKESNEILHELADPNKRAELKKAIDAMQDSTPELQRQLKKFEALESTEKELQIKMDTFAGAEKLKNLERKHHKRNKEACTGVAITIAVVTAACFLTLSAVTFGAVPAAMVVATGLALLGVFAKTLYVDYKKRQDYEQTKLSYNKNHQQLFAPPPKIETTVGNEPLIPPSDSENSDGNQPLII